MPFANYEHVFARLAAVRSALSLRTLRRSLGAVTLLAALLGPAVSAHADTPYQSPFAGDQFYVGRTDMGVDACLTPGAPIRAVGDGVVVGIYHDWFANQPYIWYQLTSGPNAGRYVYVAEQINHLARIGQTLQAGDVVARYARKGTCIETGWSAADGETWAAATTGYYEGEVTNAGISFAHFLISVGVPGEFELTAPQSQLARLRKRHHRPKHKPATPSPTATVPSSSTVASPNPVPSPTS